MVGAMATSQFLEKIMAIIRLMYLVVMMWSMLKSQENRKNRLYQKNQKAKNELNPKNCQKVEIHQNFMLKRLDQIF